MAVVLPEESAKILIVRFFSANSSLGQKIEILCAL